MSDTIRTPSRLAREVDLGNAWNATDDDLAVRFHPLYDASLRRLAEGSAVLRGLPFRLGQRRAGRRWILVGEGAPPSTPIAIDLRPPPLDRDVSLEPARASHLVVAHFADSWRDTDGRRPAGLPVGWVVPAGEPLARYELRFAGGPAQIVDIRRRFEIADGIIGWGYLPFLALGHRADEPIDWRGPHARLEPGLYAPAGHAGPLTMLPGAWGPAQTGVADFVPSATADITCWLHAIPLGNRSAPIEMRVMSLGGGRPGSDVVIAGVTLFAGTADPLVLAPRRQVRVDGPVGWPTALDLGIAIRTRPLDDPEGPVEPGDPIGWGRPRGRASAPDEVPVDRPRPSILDLALAPDARIRFGSWEVGAAELDRGATSPDGRTTIRPLPAPDIRVDVRVTAGGVATASRVRFVSSDGRYLPPLGHRDEINPGLFEDSGAGLILGRDTYAYVEGSFEIDLPPGTVEVEVVKGFDHRPVRRAIDVGPAMQPLEIALERVIDLAPGGWRSSDSHVHFLAPSTALLQAAAEDLDWVHVLATQLGDEFKSTTDLAWGGARDPSGRHEVLVGTENRQNMLGHLALLGARRPIRPFASGGAPEGRIGAETRELLADWADRCHAEGGLVVGAHFPLPFAEIAANVVAGRIDALEFQVFAPGLDNPSILEWYRLLNCGYRVPVLGGTDKMSAEVPVGAVRTYARLDPDVEPGFAAWADAVRAGRTFATSGPVIELTVDGREPGSVLSLPRGGGRLEVAIRARSSQPVIGAVELVVNGRVVATELATGSGAELLSLSTTIEVASGSWIAARSRSDHEIHSAFNTSMAAHSSPVYVEVADRPLFVADDATAILQVIDGTVAWLETMATVGDPAVRARLAGRVAESASALRARAAAAVGGGPPGG